MKKIFIGLFLVFGLMAGASAAECTMYEQSHPAWILDGSHLSTGKCSSCASCHKGGVFMGTPRNCVSCHNGDPLRTTVGRSSAHIPTGLVECNTCHNTTAFTANVGMEHSAVTNQRCDSCHGGTFTSYGARTKSSSHVFTTADCITCHTTQSWSVSHEKLHMGVTTGCVTCHNGQTAVGKSSYSAGHPVTSDQCETCHSINNAFKCAENGVLEFLQDIALAFSNRVKQLNDLLA